MAAEQKAVCPQGQERLGEGSKIWLLLLLPQRM